MKCRGECTGSDTSANMADGGEVETNSDRSGSPAYVYPDYDDRGHGHSFVKKTFHKPTYCHHCTDMLWGLIGQGLVCEGEYMFVIFQRTSSSLSKFDLCMLGKSYTCGCMYEGYIVVGLRWKFGVIFVLFG